MPVSLYDISIASYLQLLTGVAGFLDKGLAHCKAKGIDPSEIVGTRLHPDMLPFSFQVHSIAHHSLGAIDGVRKGVFSPQTDQAQLDYEGFQKLIADTRESLKKLTPAEVNALEGRDVTFQFRDFKLPFTAENFILSFSLPNFYFHATTAYDILRMKGVAIGKRDFTGPLRLKT